MVATILCHKKFPTKLQPSNDLFRPFRANFLNFQKKELLPLSLDKFHLISVPNTSQILDNFNTRMKLRWDGHHDGWVVGPGGQIRKSHLVKMH